MFSVLSNVLGLGVASAALRSDAIQLDPPPCDCGSNEVYLLNHDDGCDLKEYFEALSDCSVDEIGEYWNAVPYSARSYVLECIKADSAAKYTDAVATLAPYYAYIAQTPAGRSAMAAFDKVEAKLAILAEPTWDDLGVVYKAMEVAYAKAFRNDDLKSSVLDLEMLDARFDAMEAYLLAVYKYSKFAQNPNDIVMMSTTTNGSSTVGSSVRYNSSVTAGKWVSTNGDDFKLTLESWVGGFSTDLSRPSDIVLVLDQSASMYTPVGLPFALWHYKIYEDNPENLERFGIETDDTLDGILNMLADPTVDETSKLTYAEKFAQLGYLVAQSRVGSSEYCETEEHAHTDRDANVCGIPAHVHTSECWANCSASSDLYNIVSVYNSWDQWRYSSVNGTGYNKNDTNVYDKTGRQIKLYPLGDNYFRVSKVADGTVSEIANNDTAYNRQNSTNHKFLTITKPMEDHPLMTLIVGDVIRINTNGQIDLSYPQNSYDGGEYDRGGSQWAKGTVTIDIIADSYGVGAGWFRGNDNTVSTEAAFGANGNPYQAFGYTNAAISQQYPNASKNVLGTADYRLTDNTIVSQLGVNNLSDTAYVKFINNAGGKADAWIRLDYNNVYYDTTSTSAGYALGQTRRFDTFEVYGFSGVGYGTPERVRVYRYRTSLKSYEEMANTTIHYEYSNDYGYKVVVRLDDVIEEEDLIAIRITSTTSQLLIDEVVAEYSNRVPYNIVENDACYGNQQQFEDAPIFVEGNNTYYKTEFGNLHYYNYNSVNNHSVNLSTILTDGVKNATDVGTVSGDNYLRLMKRDGNANDTKQPYLIFDLGTQSDNNRSRTYKIYGAGGTWGVASPLSDTERYIFKNISIYVSNDQVNWTLVNATMSYKMTGAGAVNSTVFDLYEVTYKSESFQYGRYVKFEFGDCHHLWMSEIEIIREYNANSDIDVRYYNRTGTNHQHDNACADCGLIAHEHNVQCGFTCPYETHTHEFCEISCSQQHEHTDACYTCGKIYHVHESQKLICKLTKEEIIRDNHIHTYSCYDGKGCLYCKVSHVHDEECESLTTCGKTAHTHNVDCIGGEAGGCTFNEHDHDNIECYRTAECKATFLSSGGHTHHTAECFTCGSAYHEHDERCGISCFYIEKNVMYPKAEHIHSSANSYDCWTYDWFVVQYDIGEDGVVGATLNKDGTYALSANSDDIIKMYRIVTTASPSQDSNAFTSLPQLENNCLEIKLDELGKNQFYFYKSQTGALMDSLAMFLNSLNDSGMNHRVSIVGFASEYYNTEYAGGTGLYINGEFKSLIQTEGFVDGFGNPTEFIDLHRTFYDDYKAMYKEDPATYPEYYAAQDAWAAAIEAGTDNPNVYTGTESLSYRNLKKYTLDVYHSVTEGITNNGANLITEQDYKDALMLLNPQFYQESLYDPETCYQNVMNSLFAIKTDYYYTNQYLGMYMASQIFANNPLYAQESGDYNMNGKLEEHENLRQRMVVMFTDGVAQQNAMEPSSTAYKYQAYTIDKVLEYARQMENEYRASVYTICTSTVNISEHATEDVSYLYYSTSDFADDKETTDTDEAIYTVSQGKVSYPLTTENISKLKKFMRVEGSTQMIDAFNAVLADAGGSYAQLDETAIMQDVISEYFVLPDELVAIIDLAKSEGKECNSTNYPEIKDYIKVYTVDAIDGSEAYYYTFPDGTEGYLFDGEALISSGNEYVNVFADAEISIGINPNGRHYLRVTNFDYAENFVSVAGRDLDKDGEKDFWGKKLMTVLTVEVADNNFGGNGLPTNESDAYTDSEYDFSGIFSCKYSESGELMEVEKVAEFYTPCVDIVTDVTIITEILNGRDNDTITINGNVHVFDKYLSDEYSGNSLWIETHEKIVSHVFDNKNQSITIGDVKVETDLTLTVDGDDLNIYDVEYAIYQRVTDDYSGDFITVGGKKYVYVSTETDTTFFEEVISGMLVKVIAVKKDVGANIKITHNFIVNGAFVGSRTDRPVADVEVFKFAPYDTVVSVTTTSSELVSLDASKFDVAIVFSTVDLRLENGTYSFNVVDGRDYEIVFDYTIDSIQDSVDGEVGVNQTAGAIAGDGLYDVITTVTSKGNSRPVDLVFVVDISDNVSSGETDTKLTQVKDELTKYITNSFALNSNVRVAIITYADNCEMVTNGYATTKEDALNAVVRIVPATDNNGYAITLSNLQSGLYVARNLINSDAIGAYTDVIVIKGSTPNAAYVKLASGEAYNYSVVTQATSDYANEAAQWEINRMAATRVNQIDISDAETNFGERMTEVFDARNYINVDAGISITVNTDDFVLVESAGIFVDFNGDGVFVEKERLMAGQYNYVDGVITINLGTLDDEVKIKHTLELKDKVSGDHFVSKTIAVNYYNAIKSVRETAYGVSPRVNYNKTTTGATITIIPYLAGEADAHRPLGNGGLTVKLSKEDVIIGNPIVYKVSGVTNLTAGNTYTVKAPVMAGYTLWEDVDATETIVIPKEGGDFVVYFPYYESGALVDDSIVYDESVPVVFDVLSNDKQPSGETFKTIYGIGLDKNIAEGASVIETVYGKIEVINGKIKYTTKGIKEVTEVFYYAVKDSFGKLRIGTIYVVPATIVKIDSSNDSLITSGDKWQIMDNNGNIVNGDPNDYVSNKNPNDADDIYGGYEYSNTSQFKFDAGYALYANRYQDYIANGNVDVDNKYYTTTFTFEGTGFDIISVTGKLGGYVTLKTYDENGFLVKEASGNILTYSNNPDIYQATIFTYTDLTHGKYTVEVVALKTVINAIGMNDAQVFIDSLRVYNPFNGNSNAHYNDTHNGTKTNTLRDVFADGKLAIGNIGEGMFILSGYLKMEDFVSKGTNNAINIDKGQSLLLSLNEASAHTSLQVEMAAFQGEAVVNVVVNNDEVDTIFLDSAIFAYYDFSKYIRENSTVKFEVVEGNVIFSKVRYKYAELVAPTEGDKYAKGEFVQNGTAPEKEWMSDNYRINSVYIAYNKKEGTRIVTAIIYTSANVDTVIAYTSGYRISPSARTIKIGEMQNAFIMSYVIPETDTAGEAIDGTIQISFYAYNSEAMKYSANSKTVSHTFFK